MVRRIQRSGVVGPPLTVAHLALRGAGLPRMAVSGDQVILAWTEAGKAPVVHAAMARLASSAVFFDGR